MAHPPLSRAAIPCVAGAVPQNWTQGDRKTAVYRYMDCIKAFLAKLERDGQAGECRNRPMSTHVMPSSALILPHRV
jgi:hypothetical protein